MAPETEPSRPCDCNPAGPGPDNAWGDGPPYYDEDCPVHGRPEIIGAPTTVSPAGQDRIPTTAARRDALFWTAAALIIVITAAFCTVLCLATRGPWWGKAIVCAMGTFNGVFAWWLICRPERDHA